MNNTRRKWTRIFVSGGLFTPRGLVYRALIIAAAYLIAGLVGLREYTSILSGTAATLNPHNYWPVFYGLLYVILYFSAVLVAPILLIAAVILAGFQVVIRRWRR